MKVSHFLAAAGAMLTLSAGAALAAEACKCCKDMATDARMSCCDKMKTEPAPTEPAPAEPAPQEPAGATTPSSLLSH